MNRLGSTLHYTSEDARSGEQRRQDGLPRDERAENAASALAHDVGQHRAELDVGALQDLVDALDVRGALSNELLACACQGRGAPEPGSAARTSRG